MGTIAWVIGGALVVLVVGFVGARWFIIPNVSPVPGNLGVQPTGQLAPVPAAPNSVSSYATDAGHRIAPFTYTGDPVAAQQRLVAAINTLNPAPTILREVPGYLHVEAYTPTMRFRDDLEFYFDPATPGQIQVRSAARLGQGDGGTNRRRVEAVRAAFNAQSVGTFAATPTP